MRTPTTVLFLATAWPGPALRRPGLRRRALLRITLLGAALLGTTLLGNAAQASTGYALAVSTITGQTVAVLAGVGPAAKAPAVTPPTVPEPTTAVQVITSAEQQVFARLNQSRMTGVNCPGSGPRPGVGALRSSSLHTASAFRQASYMARSGEVSHIGPGGTTPRSRAASSGIQTTSVTEIIYLGGRLDPEAAVQWWLHSPVHCSIVTGGEYTTAGVSVVRGDRGTAYVVVLTSTPK